MADSTGEITNKDLVLFALYELGGAEKLVHTEEVAVQVFQYPLGRQWYQWEKYPEYPDKERVARELRRLKNTKGNALVKGHVNIGAKKDRLDGWMLTAAGVDRINSIEKKILAALGREEVTHFKYDIGKVRSRITATSCYKLYLLDSNLKEANDHDFTDMLYCLPDASNQRIRDAYDKLLASAKAVSATDLIDFLEAARYRFREFFH
jgi:hypothetical protein